MDITTMVFVLALGNLALCAALFFFEFGSARSPALSTWAIARQCQAAGWLLLYFRGTGVAPDLVSIPLGYTLLFTGVALEAGSLWEAAGRARWRRFIYPALGVAVAAFLACYFIDQLGLRVVASSLILGGFYMAGAVALALGWKGGSMLRRFMVVALAMLSLLVAARGILVLSMPGGWGWLSNSLVQALSSGAFVLLMLLTAFGYLLLAREQLQREIERMEVVDTLTDAPNRRGFFNLLAPWMALARRPGLPTAVVLLDLDQFKRINDSYGHPAGDAVVRAMVDTCKRQLRDSDILGRMAGVEFALLLPRTDLLDALLVAERIRRAIEAAPVKTERALVKMTASFGVTTIRPEDTTVSLFKRADEALRAAKAGGRNKVVQAVTPVAPEAWVTPAS
ncbi:GGDEF domain-containing protein [Massilia cavernae]|uniref:diguanylate cyclase n=1 Tax=Massilia cavernae TaxID=2320864 RepID=A0A418X840_9BURK|nr:sensor domain-containing diguanylate cyclase [Massilia cavernae]RJG08568.1 sensor domain-containing diguanylate cyclase [Massilia cavernae]